MRPDRAAGSGGRRETVDSTALGGFGGKGFVKARPDWSDDVAEGTVTFADRVRPLDIAVDALAVCPAGVGGVSFTEVPLGMGLVKAEATGVSALGDATRASVGDDF
jgi:hypothetical protein